MKDSESEIIKDIENYVKNTYGGHYVGKDQVQIVDLWESLGNVETTARDTAMKYLMRYGKKDGKNKKDLLKIIHYAILALHYGGHGETYTEQNK